MTATVTDLLVRGRGRRREVADELFERLYAELQQVARRQLRSSDGATLSTAELVNETYVRVVDQGVATWEDRAHFFSYAATAMRHVLVDRARRRSATKRGGGQRALTFTERGLAAEQPGSALIDLHDALESLREEEPRLAKVVDLRFFAGLTEEEAADVLGVSSRTVRRDWFKARGVLHSQLVPPRGSER